MGYSAASNSRMMMRAIGMASPRVILIFSRGS